MSIATSQLDRKQYRRQKLERLRAKAKARAPELAEHAHPLDPLSADELERVVDIVQRHSDYRYGMRFGMVGLKEPARSDASPTRTAEVILIDNTSRGSFRVDVDLDAGSVVGWQRIEGQPAIAPDEFAETELAVKMDGRVLEALRRRGLDLEERSQINVDPWSAGYYDSPDERDRRIARALIYVKHGLEDNQYAHVVDGLSAIVDLNDQEVVAVHDDAVLPLPQQCANWAASYQEHFRTDIKPLEISQPEGPSFTVEGNLVRWQKWQFRVGFTPREGLVLHDVAYDDDGEVRSLFHRISVAEMTVPYGDDAFLQYRKNAFDIGEYGVGILANSLERGCDCLGEIYYFDASYINAFGELMPIPNAVCMHEEDDGILWKHYDFRTDKTEVRRSRKLVVSFIATVGNYEYAFYWHFRQDASIECEIKATGVVQTGALPDGETSKFGTMLAPNLYGVNHQHHFCVRMHAAIDGEHNQVTEVDTVADPIGPSNPFGNAFYAKRTTFERESEAQRNVDLATARYWIIQSSRRKNGMGHPTGYKIEPGESAPPFAQPGSSLHQRAGYLWHHLWVTRFDESERYPAGDFPNQNPGGDGLPRWVEQDRAIKDEDIVVWHVLGHHHIPRAEDWPVMPVAKLGFKLKPVNFFDRNPALDVPPSPPKHHSDDFCEHCSDG
ncbi:MAG TPA: primary-amine oxidase [Solirubrobacteraceae bacterium]|nr:primary-amine oxidase [Solirubrobacteraceae bacterium]